VPFQDNKTTRRSCKNIKQVWKWEKKRASHERKKEVIEMCILVVNIPFNSPGSSLVWCQLSLTTCMTVFRHHTIERNEKSPELLSHL
jgi:hypothetical protein